MLMKLVVITTVMLSSIITGCISSTSQRGMLNGFEVHEWGVFCQRYKSNIVNVVTKPLEEPVIVKKPVIYFHYRKDISDVFVEVNFDGDILVTIPDAASTDDGISWTVDIVNKSVVAPNGTVYKYLFYECQIKYSKGVIAYILDDGINVKFYIMNVADYPISDIFFIYGYPTGTPDFMFRGITYVKIERLESYSESVITVPLNNNSLYGTSEILYSLIENGLTEQEAEDLIDYWEKIWFYPTNLGSYAQILYTIPEDIYNELLPISIYPQPEIIKRVGLFFITDVPINSIHIIKH